MEKKKYTAALIGLGRIGFSLGFDKRREQPASHTMALKDNKRIQIIAGCDTNASRREEWIQYVPRASVYSNTAHLFAACRPDILIIAVNESAHLETTLEAIRSRPRLIILEKPVALNMNDGRQIAEDAEFHQIPILVNHERRFAQDYAIAREYMKKIGTIQSIHASLHSGLRVYSPKDEESGTYSLLHDGTHLIDVVKYLLSVLVMDEESERNKLQFTMPIITGMHLDKDDKTIVRYFAAHFRTQICSDITFSFSGNSHFFGFEIDILGTEGRIRIGNGLAEFYTRHESKLYSGFYSLEKEKTPKIPKKTGYFANMIQNGVDYLDGKAPIKSTLKDGLDTLQVIDDLRLQLKNYLHDSR
ncbi:MAG: Gfo/Idh/MocA family oxidoreductase [Treponema sp.]|nr:Gfo/Idh/MocA family oxidoreductase [Treponema sp.]